MQHVRQVIDQAPADQADGFEHLARRDLVQRARLVPGAVPRRPPAGHRVLEGRGLCSQCHVGCVPSPARNVSPGCHSGVVAGFGLVRRSPGLAGLLAAQTISPLGDAMATTALILHVQRTTGSATAVGLLLFAQAIPPLAAPLAGVIADRPMASVNSGVNAA